MAVPLIVWGVVAGGAALFAVRSTDAVIEDVDTLGDVAIGAITGVAIGTITDNALLGVSAGLSAFVLARQRGPG